MAVGLRNERQSYTFTHSLISLYPSIHLYLELRTRRKKGRKKEYRKENLCTHFLVHHMLPWNTLVNNNEEQFVVSGFALLSTLKFLAIQELFQLHMWIRRNWENVYSLSLSLSLSLSHTHTLSLSLSISISINQSISIHLSIYYLSVSVRNHSHTLFPFFYFSVFFFSTPFLPYLPRHWLPWFLSYPVYHCQQWSHAPPLHGVFTQAHLLYRKRQRE